MSVIKDKNVYIVGNINVYYALRLLLVFENYWFKIIIIYN